MKRFKYSPEQIEFLRTGYQSMNVHGLTKAFNKRFGMEKSETAIHSALTNHKITCGRAHKDRLVDRHRIYNDEHLNFLRVNYKQMTRKELTKAFNEHFGTQRTENSIKACINNHKIRSGRSGCFEKGIKPWNTGTKGLTGRNKTSFKKGNIPPNVKPLWDERICPKDGFILMKVPEENPYTGFSTRYKHKHVWVWEQEHGPVPEGMVVAFRDGNKLNCNLDNLMLLARAELLFLNQYGYKDAPDELKPSILAMAKLKAKAFRVAKE